MNPLPLRPSVLLAEDDPDTRDLLATYLADAGIDVEVMEDGHALRDRLLESGPNFACDAVVTDVQMPGWTGMDALRWLGLHHPAIPVVVMTAFGDAKTRERAERLGAFAVCDKPELAETLCAIVFGIFRARTKRGDSPQRDALPR